MTSEGFLNDMKYYENPSGSLLMGKNNYHHPFKKTEADFFKKHHKSVSHKKGDIPPEFKRRFHQHESSVTNDFNNLMNFNPTMGNTFFDEHETNNMLHGGVGTRPRYEVFNYKDTFHTNKIDNWKKPGNHTHTILEHSQKLNVRKNF